MIALLVLGSPAWATLSVVQTAHFASASGNSWTNNITTTAGNLLVGIVGESSNNTANFTMTDSASQSWTQDGSYVNNGTTDRAGMFYMANSAALTSVTVNFGALLSNVTLTVYEISGAATTSVTDGVATSSGSGISSLTSGSLTTSNATDILLYGVFARNSNSTSFTAGTGYTLPVSASGQFGGMQYQIVSSTQSAVTTSMSWTSNSLADGIIAAFKAAGGGPAPYADYVALMGAGCK